MKKIIGTGIIREGLEISEEQLSAKTHAEAVENIEKLNKEMGDDWRLPTREELDLFVGMKGATDHFLWTSTPYYANNDSWVIEGLSAGNWYGNGYTGTSDYRCVRKV